MAVTMGGSAPPEWAAWLAGGERGKGPSSGAAVGECTAERGSSSSTCTPPPPLCSCTAPQDAPSALPPNGRLFV